MSEDRSRAVFNRNNKEQDFKIEKLLIHIRNTGFNGAIECYLRGKAFSEGLKIFRPKLENLEALEHMTLNVEFSEYVQPYPTIIIEFPPQYSNRMTAHNPLPGPRPMTGIVGKEHHSPTFVILHHRPQDQVIFTGVFFDSGDVFCSLLWKMNRAIEGTLEEALTILHSFDAYEGSLPIEDEENNMSFKARRIALNCVLIMEEMGIKKLGVEKPKKYEKLVSQSKNPKNKKTQKEAKEELKNIPVIYTFDQNVKLFNHETVSTGATREGGYTIKPHFRRGFYKMQPWGPGFTLRKRIRIAPVLVNAHLFKGDISNTKVTYDT